MARSVYGAGVLSLYTVQYTVYTVYVVRVRYFSNFSYSVYRIPLRPRARPWGLKLSFGSQDPKIQSLPRYSSNSFRTNFAASYIDDLVAPTIHSSYAGCKVAELTSWSVANTRWQVGLRVGSVTSWSRSRRKQQVGRSVGFR